MKLATSLHRVGSDLVNSYLVEDASGVTVIDAGLPGNYRDLLAELRAMGRSIEEVRAVILTHADTDHIGYAERLRRDHGIPIRVHELEAARARGEEKSNGSQRPGYSPGTVRRGTGEWRRRCAACARLPPPPESGGSNPASQACEQGRGGGDGCRDDDDRQHDGGGEQIEGHCLDLCETSARHVHGSGSVQRTTSP